MTQLQARVSKKITASMENSFSILKDQVTRFRQHLTTNKEPMLKTLSSYQSYATSEDEFHRIFECLDSIEELREYFTRRTGSVAVFFPLNMPIYALVLYAVFPSLVADSVSVRAPQRMTHLMCQLKPLLQLETYFPSIEIVATSREEFVREHVMSADVIIFTGKLANAQHVMRKCKKDSLFLFNGWGCNPIVIGEDTDLKVAAEKTVSARLFSSGQDCAGPDTVLVSKKDSVEFVAKLKETLKTVSVGSYSDPNVTVGPLADEAQIRLIGNILAKSADHIVHGGLIDYQARTVHPTVIVNDLSVSMNFEELFAPVIYVNTYEDVSQLPRYFEHPSYIANEMYITLFGSCQYVEALQKSVVVKDQVIFDIDRGNDEFGGYSMGASFASSNRRIIPKPILVPREIHDHLQPGSAGYKFSPSMQAKIGKQVRKAMVDIFSSNLVFGFVFGSVARQQATGASDINTMVVVSNINEAHLSQYDTWLRQLHARHEMKFKEDLSMLVLTVSELEDLCNQLKGDHQILKSLKVLLPTEALSGAQCGVSGDKKLSVEYGRRFMPHSATTQRKRPLEGLSAGVEQQVGPKERGRNDDTLPQANSLNRISAPPPAESKTPSSSIELSKTSGLNKTKQKAEAKPRKSRNGFLRALCRRWKRVRQQSC